MSAVLKLLLALVPSGLLPESVNLKKLSLGGLRLIVDAVLGYEIEHAKTSTEADVLKLVQQRIDFRLGQWAGAVKAAV